MGFRLLGGALGNWDVLVTREIPDEGVKMLKAVCRSVTVHGGNRPMPRQKLLAGIKGKDGLVSCLNDKVDAALMDASRVLKVISNFAVGIDNIDVAAASERGIAVTNTPGVLTDATAELAWALLFAVCRRIAEGDRFTKSGEFHGWAPLSFLGFDIHGKTLGVIGAGRIGSAFALKSRGFDMKVLYYDSVTNETLEEKLRAKKVKLNTLLKDSDFVSVHVPLTEATHHLLSSEQFDIMKPAAILINTSRGPVVDEKALVRALKSKLIAGAGLDVYEREPEIEPELLKLTNTVLCPHVGSATVETRTKMSVMACTNLIDVLSGKKPPNPVNLDQIRKRGNARVSFGDGKW
jgi:D-3-phosphoglycerate dehydrogenase